MTDAGLKYLRKILGDVDISDAAIWADWYKDTPEGKHTGSWHFINGHDNPPISCVLDLATDCPEGNGCIVTAILNTVWFHPQFYNFTNLTAEDEILAYKKHVGCGEGHSTEVPAPSVWRPSPTTSYRSSRTRR